MCKCMYVYIYRVKGLTRGGGHRVNPGGHRVNPIYIHIHTYTHIVIFIPAREIVRNDACLHQRRIEQVSTDDAESGLGAKGLGHRGDD